MGTYAGIDLHSSNNYIGIMDQDYKRLFGKRLAHMKHLNILPEGYIYPKEQRAVRDLLRRRLFFVKHRTSNILSLQSTITRNLGIKMSSNEIKKLDIDDACDLFNCSNLVFMA